MPIRTESLTKQDRKSFCEKIEAIVSINNISYMDAIVMCSEDHDIEIEVAAKFLSEAIKSKLFFEAQSLNLLPKTSKLDI